MITAEKDCYREIQALAIGGGGAGAGSQGGGGSGYIEFQTLRIRENMKATVGQAGESSEIEINDRLVLSAAPGEDCIGVRGGAGYSGGGGYGAAAHTGGDGGENGGDGEDGQTGSGGDGSGFDLTTVNMENFILSPGKAGTTSSTNGGGGGGVIVNGEKPTGGSSFDGEGYGGGANGNTGQKPGCVLIEL